jgi:hypothetical protein
LVRVLWLTKASVSAGVILLGSRSNFGSLHRCTLVRAERNSVELSVVILYFYFFMCIVMGATQQ